MFVEFPRLFHRPYFYLFSLLVFCSSCNQAAREESYLNLSNLTDSFDEFDSIQVIVHGSDGSLVDTAFHGHVNDKADLSGLSVPHYHGEKVDISITGYLGGQVVYATSRTYDGAHRTTDSIIVRKLPGTVVRLASEDTMIKVGDSLPLPAVTVTPENLFEKTVTWNSSDPRIVALVSGNLYALKVGIVRLTAVLVSDTTKHAGYQVTVTADTVVRDTVPPEKPVVNGATPTNSKRPEWTWTGGGGGSGKFRWNLDSEAFSDIQGKPDTRFSPGSDLKEGEYTLFVQESDSAGNWSSSGSFKIRVDLTPPAAPKLRLKDTLLVERLRPTWNWTGDSLGGSGVYQYRLDTNDFTQGSTQVTHPDFTPSIDLTDGKHTLYVQERDSVGNWSSSGSATVRIITIVSKDMFAHKQVFHLNTKTTGANVAGDVHNIPLLIRLANPAILDSVQANAPDIRFSNDGGETWLDHSVERWDKSRDSAEVWVRMPVVRGNSTSDSITLFYGQRSVPLPDKQCAACVFGAEYGFAAVWHLGKNLGDSSGNKNHGASIGSTAGEGIIGGGQAFDGTGQRVDFGNGTALQSISEGETVEAWIKTSQIDSVASVLRHDGHFTALQLSGDGKNAHSAIWNPDLQPMTFQWSDFAIDEWAHFAVAFSTSGTRIYRNGQVIASYPASAPLVTTGTKSFFMGASEDKGDEPYQGKLDEVRVSKVARSTDWINLEYQNQRKPPTLFNKP